MWDHWVTYPWGSLSFSCCYCYSSCTFPTSNPSPLLHRPLPHLPSLASSACRSALRRLDRSYGLVSFSCLGSRFWLDCGRRFLRRAFAVFGGGRLTRQGHIASMPPPPLQPNPRSRLCSRDRLRRCLYWILGNKRQHWSETTMSSRKWTSFLKR